MKNQISFSYKKLFLPAAMAIALLPLLVSIKASAVLPSKVPGYRESLDGEVWTIEEALPNMHDKYISNPSCWYEHDTVTADTGNVSVLDSREEWQHEYNYVRDSGIAPVKYWRVNHRPARCIHAGDELIEGFHNIPDTTYSCLANYYSGWIPYCADCGTELVYALHYLSMDAVSQITELDMSKGYFYNCQFCGNLEQGFDHLAHYCKGVSTNRYAVRYDSNAIENIGTMRESLHMYNNDYLFEGKVIVPQTRLNVCTFKRTGYVFKGWSTEPGEQEVVYEDGAEIYNLTKIHYDENNVEEGSFITLYAQWEKVKTTLIIDAGNGYYGEQQGQKEIVQEYATFYTINESLFKPGKGYKVNFESNGGSSVSSIQKDNVYKGYATGGNHNGRMAGRMKGNDYFFLGPLGTIDRIVAKWEQPGITLPETTKSGYTFGGWYLDEACTRPIGTAGDRFVPISDCVLYAKWVTLHLTATDNYTDHDGKGAVDLEWTMPNPEENAYVISQSMDGVTFERLYDAKDSINPTENSIDGVYEYTGAIKQIRVPYNGYYEVEVSGAQGEDFIMKDETTGEDITYYGGKGSQVTAKFYFQKDEVLTLTVGGQEGWSSGGEGGENGGNGGGFSGIYSNKQGWLVKAAGGGGGGIVGDGGDADAGITFTTDSNGEDGNAGGGGGAFGGLAGVYEVHTHTEECYEYIHEEHTTFESAPGYNGTNPTILYEDEWTKDWKSKGGYAKIDGGYYSSHNVFFSGIQLFSDHRLNSFTKTIGLDGALKPTPIPTYGHEKVKFTVETFYHFVLETNYFEDYSVELYNQAGVLIGKEDMTEEVNNAGENAIGYLGVLKEISFDIPAGTSGVYLVYNCSAFCGKHNSASNPIFIYFRKLFLETNRKELICGYEEREVVYKQSSTGGSSNVLGNPVSYSMEYGTNEGDGEISIVAKDIGYMEETSLKGVKATDTAPPKKVENLKIDYTRSNEERLCITFSPTEDVGSAYYHKVDAYLLSTGSYLTTSNITKNTLTTGVAGYCYYLDSISHTELQEIKDEKLLQWTNEGAITVELKEEVQYLHMAAVDKAGNLGETTHLKIPGTVEDSEELEGFSLEAWAERILYPNEPVFKRGESGELHIVTKGYADRVEVLFPIELGGEKLEVYQVFHYDGTEFEKAEKISFQIPLYMEEGEKVIQVWAYRKSETPEELSASIVIQVRGSVLDEIRTRLR